MNSSGAATFGFEHIGVRADDIDNVDVFKENILIPKTDLGKQYLGISDDTNGLRKTTARINKMRSGSTITLDLDVPRHLDADLPPTYLGLGDKCAIPGEEFVKTQLNRLLLDIVTDYDFRELFSWDEETTEEHEKRSVYETEFFKSVSATAARIKKEKKHVTDEMLGMCIAASVPYTRDAVNASRSDKFMEKMRKAVGPAPVYTEYVNIWRLSNDASEKESVAYLKSQKEQQDAFSRAQRAYELKQVEYRLKHGADAFAEMMEHLTSSKDMTRHLVVVAVKCALSSFLRAYRMSWIVSDGRNSVSRNIPVHVGEEIGYESIAKIVDGIYGDLEETYDITKNAVKVITILSNVLQPTFMTKPSGLVPTALTQISTASTWLSPAASALAYLQIVLRYFVL